MDGDGPITVIRVPPDTCPNDGCNQEHIQPYRTGPNYRFKAGPDALTGYYQCPDCNFYWDTAWRIEPVTPTREG